MRNFASGNPILPIVVMDSGLARSLSSGALCADPVARLGMTKLGRNSAAYSANSWVPAGAIRFAIAPCGTEPNFQDELPTAAVPETLIVSMPPLPRAACDIKDDHGDHKGDDKNGNRKIHRNLPCCQN